LLCEVTRKLQLWQPGNRYDALITEVGAALEGKMSDETEFKDEIERLRERVEYLENMILSVRKQGNLSDVINAQIEECGRIEESRAALEGQ
jgi:hypothetical protein